MKRESNAPKRYIDEVFQELSPQRKTLRVNADRKLYPVVVTDVDKIGKRVKIHYVSYSERYDEWRSCGTDDIRFQRMEPLFIPSASSFDDRAELFHAELYGEIKRKLYSGRKDDPATRIELELTIRMCLMEGLQQQGNHGKNEERLCIELIQTRP